MIEKCPKCGQSLPARRSPAPTVDIIIEIPLKGIVLIQRANPPLGWALPGGYVDYGESLEAAACREAMEETGLEIKLLGQLHTYSDPRRDPRRHNITTVFVARALGTPQAADDARSLKIFGVKDLPQEMAFDHAAILSDYLKVRRHCGWLNLRTYIRNV
ncbi:MAG: NUDIX domain-containing protein [Desulfobaccales bacterium]